MAKKTKGAASERVLADLHGIVTEYYTNLLEDAMNEDYQISPADMNNILKLLSASNITATPDNKELAKLQAEFDENEIAAKRANTRKAIINKIAEDSNDPIMGIIH